MSIKNNLKKLFAKSKPMRITIEFKSNGDGSTTTQTKFNKNIPVSYAASALDRFKAQISAKLAMRVQDAGYSAKNPKRRAFIGKQTLGDIL